MDDLEITPLEADVTAIRLRGRLNMVGAGPLRRAITDQVERGNVRLVVDLGDVDFIDSSGLGALIGGLKTARQAGGDLRIARPNEQVRLVLQLTNVERILVPYDEVRSAFADE
jgi:anti-sigma B factor antagonist